MLINIAPYLTPLIVVIYAANSRFTWIVEDFIPYLENSYKFTDFSEV